MKAKHEDVLFEIGGVTIYKDDLDDIVRLMRCESGEPTVDADRYEYDSFEEFIAEAKELRPNKLTLRSYSKLHGYISIEFGPSGATIRPGSSAASLGLATQIYNMLRKLRRCTALPLPGLARRVVGLMFSSIFLGIFVMSIIEIASSTDKWMAFVNMDHMAIKLSIYLTMCYFTSNRVWRAVIFADKTRLAGRFWERQGGALTVAILASVIGSISAAIVTNIAEMLKLKIFH